MTFKDNVFLEMCNLCCNWYGVEVFPATTLAKRFGCSTHKIYKTLHQLRNEGLVENAVMSRPAVESYNGECHELVHEAMPPLHGFALTRKGYETETYKLRYADYIRSLSDIVSA